jgi:hypothetical protein
MRIRGDDRGAFKVHWLVKVGLAVGILGVLGYDGFVTIATHLKAEDDANNAAYAASQYWDSHPDARDAQHVYDAAVLYEQANNPADHVCMGGTDPLCLEKGHFTVDADGTVHLVVRREATTLFFKHLGFMHSKLIAFENGDANLSGGV